MAETFYHIDEHGELEVGDIMELGWPPQIKNDVVVKSLPENEEMLQEEYPQGLSRHGARYAQSGIESRDIEKSPTSLGGGWQIMRGVSNCVDIQGNGQSVLTTEPYQIQYEWVLELMRKAEFEEEQSRFQSYFAWPSLEDAEQFMSEHRDESDTIYKVECQEYEIRDMDLVYASHIGVGITNARKYWNNESGSENPTWEVVMKPPVEVVDRVTMAN